MVFTFYIRQFRFFFTFSSKQSMKGFLNNWGLFCWNLLFTYMFLKLNFSPVMRSINLLFSKVNNVVMEKCILFFACFLKFKRNVGDVYNYLVTNLNDANLISATSKKWKLVTRYINHKARWSHGNIAACYAVYTIISHTKCSLNFSLLAIYASSLLLEESSPSSLSCLPPAWTSSCKKHSAVLLLDGVP